MIETEQIQEHSDQSDVDIFFDEIERGRKGLNRGLSMGFPRLDEFICGIQKGRYDVVFAAEKAGKSSFVTSSYILNPYSILEKIGKTENLKVFYFSLEMSKNAILSKWFADRLYTEYKILIDPNLILGRNKSILPDYIYEKLLLVREYYDKMLKDCVTIYDSSMNPTGMKIIIDDYAKANGKFVGRRYVPNNPDQTVVIITDTAGNLKLERVEGIASMKTTIDQMSRYKRGFRNKYNYSPVMIMHTNRSTAEYQREKEGDVFPKVADIKESGQCSQDANLVMCVFDPTPYLDRPSIDVTNVCGGYDPYKMNRRFRCLGILSNRDGDSFVKVGMMFIGETGRFYELPKPEDITKENYKGICEIKKLII